MIKQQRWAPGHALNTERGGVMNRRRFGTIVGAVLTSAIFPALMRRGAAQDAVQFAGAVSWLSGEKMVIAPPSALPITVDRSQADLSQYSELMSGDWVIVTGTVAPERDRVIATSIQRGGA